MSVNFPAGRDALRAHAIAMVRQTLEESGRQHAAREEPLATELVDVAERYDLPISSVLAWLHFTAPRGKPISAAMFAAYCERGQ